MTRPAAPAPAELFGQTPDGQSATVYALENSHLRVRITDYGGRLVSIEAPDWSGRRGDVLLGFDNAAAYAKAGGAFGALLGRNANRIADGSFTSMAGSTACPPTTARRPCMAARLVSTRSCGTWTRNRPGHRKPSS